VYAHVLEAGMRVPLHGFFSEALAMVYEYIGRINANARVNGGNGHGTRVNGRTRLNAREPRVRWIGRGPFAHRKGLVHRPPLHNSKLKEKEKTKRK
jgi:hypothetical protein